MIRADRHPTQPREGFGSDATLFVAVLLAYAAGSQCAFLWFGADGTNASFFPAAGVTMAALMLTPRRRWLTVLLAAGIAELALDLLHDITLAASLGYVVANLVQPVVGASLMGVPPSQVNIARSTDLFRFIGAGVIIAPVAGGIIGATNFVVLDGGTGWARFVGEWWVGDGLGVLVVGGAILAWAVTAGPVPAGRIEAALVVAGTILSTFVVFQRQLFGLAPVPLALLMATAARVRTRGVAMAGAGAGFVAATLIAGGNRFWENSDLAPAEGLLYLQLAVGVALATALALAAEMSAREAAASDAARLAAARLEQETVAADDRLLATISVALDRVTTVEERRRRLAELLWEHRSIEARVTLQGEEEEPPAARPALVVGSPGAGELVPGDGAISRDLHARGRRVGRLRLARVDGEPLRLRPNLVDALVVRVGLALENARLYERERDASHSFQAALLSGPLPRVDCCELGASYRPATSSLEVGGDWYDAFMLPNGHLALVVGDVVGHGLDAAITMGQLRDAVRSLAPFSSPSEVLARLDDFVATVPDALGSTVCIVELDPESGLIAVASAGHPPPLVQPPGSAGRLLWGGRSAPLGCRNAGRPQVSGILVDGAMLVLYTDGLVERRDASLDHGFERLESAVAVLATDELGVVPEKLLTAMAEAGTYRDDACILVARVHPARTPFEYRFRADPGQLAACRAAVRTWLRELGSNADDEHSVLLAVGEAASNAVEHGYAGRDPGTIEVLAALEDDGRLLVVIRDEGRWIERDPTPGRGRGRDIMAAVMDDLQIDLDQPGTEVRFSRRLGRVGEGMGV